MAVMWVFLQIPAHVSEGANSNVQVIPLESDAVQMKEVIQKQADGTEKSMKVMVINWDNIQPSSGVNVMSGLDTSLNTQDIVEASTELVPPQSVVDINQTSAANINLDQNQSEESSNSDKAIVKCGSLYDVVDIDMDS